MAKSQKHKWTFRARFRKGAYGWRSQPALTRIKEAVSEIKKVAKTDPILGAEGAVLFLEKISPAIENVDGSSGAIGTSVYNAIVILAAIIVDAPVEEKVRLKWLERLFDAIQEDQMPYIESLSDHWADLCGTPEIASLWADYLVSTVRQMWTDTRATFNYFSGTTACLAALYKAERYQELLNLLELNDPPWWHYRVWGSRALVAMGQIDEAIRYAESCEKHHYESTSIAAECESILLSAGRADEAYEHYAVLTHKRSTHLATFRAIQKKYPEKPPGDILQRLIYDSPGEEGKWFAAAKSAGLYDLASELVKRSPCDPRTLTRAARDFAEKEPHFAIASGVAALRWISRGYGYDITGHDVSQAVQYTLDAAHQAGCTSETTDSIREVISTSSVADLYLKRILESALDS